MKDREKVFNKDGKELISIQEAEKLGYGLVDTFKMRIHADTDKEFKAIKIQRCWLVEKDYVKKRKK